MKHTFIIARNTLGIIIIIAALVALAVITYAFAMPGSLG